MIRLPTLVSNNMFEGLIPHTPTTGGDPVAALLAAREGRVLRWTALVRIVFLTVTAVIVALAIVRLSEGIAILALILLLLGVQVVVLRSLQKRPDWVSIGVLSAISDGVALCILPIIWHVVYTTENEPLLHLSRHNLTAVSLAMVALNGLTLRPLYPAVLTVVTVVLHLFLAWLAISDPRLDNFPGGLGNALGVGMSATDLMLLTPFFLGLAGILVTLAAYAMRATLWEAVGREQAEHKLRQQQLQAVLEAKMKAVGDLVAGVEHEINNPLGAMHSAVDTAEKALGRIRAALVETSTPTQRAFRAVEDSLHLVNQASQRLSGVMATIRGFVQLDKAELQHLDLAELVQRVVDMQRPFLRDDTELVVDLGKGVMIKGDPRRLSEALTTVVRNAAESFDGPGKLVIGLGRQEGWARIEIRDKGRGMTQEQVAGIFEIDFAHSERTRARFGLPLCRSILHGHGGDIRLASQPEGGTTVVVQLPLADTSRLG